MVGQNRISPTPAEDCPLQDGSHRTAEASPKQRTQSTGFGDRKSPTEASGLIGGGNQRPNTYGHKVDTERDRDSVANGNAVVTRSELSVFHVDYVVKQHVGSWWQGSCFRKARKKVVLDDISMSVKSGEITAILGNSAQLRPYGITPAVTRSELSVFHVDYMVKQPVGSWWQGACFRKARKKVVLDDISMSVKSGEITTILGNSGSGKTSLLDVITCRTSGDLTGTVFYNDVPCTRDVIKKHAAYVMQADRLLPNLTVRETLRYCARLRLPGRSTNAQIEDKVSSVIMEMGLKDVADSRIGNELIRGISGGEKRRITIAIQLLKDPDMVLLDEPTSGLDSYTARYLVSNLRDLARRGKIVLLTIHQPSSDIFKFFDQICLMSVGQMVYCGPSTNLVQYFTNLGYSCDRYTNPLDRYVDVVSVDRRDRTREEQSTERVHKLVEAFKSSSLHHATEDSLLVRSQKYSNMGPPPRVRVGGPSYARVMSTILSRMFRNLFRDRKDYVARVMLLPTFIFFILIFLGRLKHTQSSIQDRIGLLYQSCTVPAFIGMINSIALYPCLRDLFYRETVDGLYGNTTFFITYTLHILPFHVLSSIIFSSILYWVTGMQADVEKFSFYTLVVFLLQYWGEMLGIAGMGLFMNPNKANSFVALMISLNVLIGSGFLRNIQEMIDPYQWLSWVLIYKYCGEILVAGEFGGLTLDDCQVNTTAMVNTTTVNCFQNGNQYIERFFPDAKDNIGRNFGITTAYATGTLLLAVFVYRLVGPRTLH